MTYVHWGIDLTDGFVVCWELIYLDSVAHKLAHYLYLEFMQLALGDCVCFGNDGNYVDLKEDSKQEKLESKTWEKIFNYGLSQWWGEGLGILKAALRLKYT